MKPIEETMQKKKDQEGSRVDVSQCNMMNDGVSELNIRFINSFYDGLVMKTCPGSWI